MNLQELQGRVKELRHLADSCGACDGNGSWREYGTKIRCACCEEYRRELDPLEDQLAIAYNAIAERNKPPEPAWTSEPPTEPGWYWCRCMETSLGPIPEVAEVSRSADGYLYIWPDDPEREMRINYLAGWEYWPIPIPEPPR